MAMGMEKNIMIPSIDAIGARMAFTLQMAQ
jgi:hypothetical protein